ncbi:hypothetical protein N7495_001407 [Penicillium taxi]|uniref:uncharacterized protein n=1 Tax=Penicillium taxi TaxID=168475 RepID=UPI00254582C3|nr:uncharacterized protein N7495_001407 [Penicillium taxi]KAJ5908725.1 hypothetical protein N7495_001407 [Penicillium taxi]
MEYFSDTRPGNYFWGPKEEDHPKMFQKLTKFQTEPWKTWLECGANNAKVEGSTPSGTKFLDFFSSPPESYQSQVQ